MKLLSSIARRAIGAIRARPKLDFFLRRQVSRVPALANLLRRILARSRRQGWSLSAPPRFPEDKQLPDAAAKVLLDLRQAINASSKKT